MALARKMGVVAKPIMPEAIPMPVATDIPAAAAAATSAMTGIVGKERDDVLRLPDALVKGC